MVSLDLIWQYNEVIRGLSNFWTSLLNRIYLSSKELYANLKLYSQNEQFFLVSLDQLALLWDHQRGVEILDITTKLNLLIAKKGMCKYDSLFTKWTIFPFTTLLILEGQQNSPSLIVRKLLKWIKQNIKKIKNKK